MVGEIADLFINYQLEGGQSTAVGLRAFLGTFPHVLTKTRVIFMDRRLQCWVIMLHFATFIF